MDCKEHAGDYERCKLCCTAFEPWELTKWYCWDCKNKERDND